jgi:hypothetical protein
MRVEPQTDKPNQLLSELHKKSYFKTSAEIPLDFGCMRGVKQREFMEDFIVIAANLHRKHGEQGQDEAALINYLQKLYG